MDLVFFPIFFHTDTLICCPYITSISGIGRYIALMSVLRIWTTVHYCLMHPEVDILCTCCMICGVCVSFVIRVVYVNVSMCIYLYMCFTNEPISQFETFRPQGQKSHMIYCHCQFNVTQKHFHPFIILTVERPRAVFQRHQSWSCCPSLSQTSSQLSLVG